VFFRITDAQPGSQTMVAVTRLFLRSWIFSRVEQTGSSFGIRPQFFSSERLKSTSSGSSMSERAIRVHDLEQTFASIVSGAG
jgi:hypothetical protein